MRLLQPHFLASYRINGSQQQLEQVESAIKEALPKDGVWVQTVMQSNTGRSNQMVAKNFTTEGLATQYHDWQRRFDAEYDRLASQYREKSSEEHHQALKPLVDEGKPLLTQLDAALAQRQPLDAAEVLTAISERRFDFTQGILV
jgi:hypothetical protein